MVWLGGKPGSSVSQVPPCGKGREYTGALSTQGFSFDGSTIITFLYYDTTVTMGIIDV